ncbi:olfactory receptor 14J1-like [Tachyglossus aculeatus]|uniref:olfactory receptor 14J1-like n=1 Tax=Tachyglossus aculeatus TaxID=9261 RepID=UPI0018F79F8C|nr:olfactory receptor 14J1-like [Tachyglossus aculeatus]
MKEFILLGFSEVRELQLANTVLFLPVYTAVLTGNLLIVAVTTLNQRLHMFFLISLTSTEIALLMVMSFDQYLAICLPLSYEVVTRRGACGKMTASSRFSGSLSGLMQTAVTFSLPFCRSNEIHQFFCDIPQLLKFSCSDWIIAEMGISALILCLAFCFVSMIMSYVCIFSAALRMRSSEDQTKGFSTCVPHLVSVAFFFSTSSFAYLKPPSDGLLI